MGGSKVCRPYIEAKNYYINPSKPDASATEWAISGWHRKPGRWHKNLPVAAGWQ